MTLASVLCRGPVTFHPAGMDLRPCREPTLMTRLVLELYEPVEAVMRAVVYHGPGQKAYDVFARAVDTSALKMVLSRPKE